LNFESAANRGLYSGNINHGWQSLHLTVSTLVSNRLTNQEKDFSSLQSDWSIEENHGSFQSKWPHSADSTVGQHY